jgi:pyruvate/2-oxoglutarate dehydrogenase complex dihydrolipoamide dehydrogenase (E3) component
VRRAGEFGIHVPEGVDVDFAAVMERMRRLRAGISPHDSASRFRDLGIDVFFGQGKLTAADRIEVAGETLTFSRAVVATGSRAAAPAIPGLNEVEYLTNESVFSLTKLPKCFAVIGAGPIGCEMAQAFARFGSQVILVESGKGLLPKEDTDASKTILEALKRDGVLFRSGGEELTLSKTDDGRIRLAMHSPDHAHQEVVDKLLIAVGRAPNVEGLGLENAGVEYSNKGVKVNDRLQTTNSRIFAAGDVCSSYRFTHAADFMARIVIQNALFLGHSKVSSLVIPWCTYTEPEIAHVGISERRARTKGIEIETYTQPLGGVDRAILDRETEGFVRVHVKRGSDTILVQ